MILVSTSFAQRRKSLNRVELKSLILPRIVSDLENCTCIVNRILFDSVRYRKLYVSVVKCCEYNLKYITNRLKYEKGTSAKKWNV